MLTENQIIRLLKQSESAYAGSFNNKKRRVWKGWIQALKLVLEQDTYPIRNTPLKEEHD